jgi:competence protein CoiA
MSLYAVDGDDLIDAYDAECGKTYWCLDCFGPMKKRAKRQFPHFYHLKPTPTCRLYSKTEDHLLIQLQIQKSFSPATLQLEKPFPLIQRVADICWEKEKIIFEIQCSPLSEIEARSRIRDYGSLGYDVIWLLDDRRFNKRAVPPVEQFLRTHSTYYISFQRGLQSLYYDQFEVLFNGRRLKKGRPMLLNLQNIRKFTKNFLPQTTMPEQILALSLNRHIQGDRVSRALQNHFLTMQRWRDLEIKLQKSPKKPNRLLLWLKGRLLAPYERFLERMIRKMS